MDFRYHPIIENLKVNEDGSEIIYLGKSLISKTYTRKENSIPMQVVNIGRKIVTVMRLVNEAWNGVAENADFITKRIDEDKPIHYSNLCWSKRGQGISHRSSKNFNAPKFNAEQYKELLTEIKKAETITAFLKRKNISTKAFYTAKRKYEKNQ